MKGGATMSTRGLDAVFSGMKNLEKLRGMTVKVGVQKGATDDKGGLIAPYAAMNNFGTKNAMGGVLIPARPFMVYSAKGIKEWMESAAFSELVSDVQMGRLDAVGAAHKIGTVAVGITKRNIMKSDQYEQNSETTLAIKRKKNQGSKPLVASESLYKSIRYVIER